MDTQVIISPRVVCRRAWVVLLPDARVKHPTEFAGRVLKEILTHFEPQGWLYAIVCDGRFVHSIAGATPERPYSLVAEAVVLLDPAGPKLAGAVVGQIDGLDFRFQILPEEGEHGCQANGGKTVAGRG